MEKENTNKEQSTASLFEQFYGKPYSHIKKEDMGEAKKLDWGEDVGSESPASPGQQISPENFTSAGKHEELINGKIETTECNTPEHNQAVRVVVGEFEKKVGSGCNVFSANVPLFYGELADDLGFDSDFFLPDVMVTDDRAKVDSKGVHSAPVFVAEVTTESSRALDYGYKAIIYFVIGVKEYWVFDMKIKRIVRWLMKESGASPEKFGFPDTKILTSQIYPHVEINLADVFAVE